MNPMMIPLFMADLSKDRRDSIDETFVNMLAVAVVVFSIWWIVDTFVKSRAAKKAKRLQK